MNLRKTLLKVIGIITAWTLVFTALPTQMVNASSNGWQVLNPNANGYFYSTGDDIKIRIPNSSGVRYLAIYDHNPSGNHLIVRLLPNLDWELSCNCGCANVVTVFKTATYIELTVNNIDKHVDGTNNLAELRINWSNSAGASFNLGTNLNGMTVYD
ncbi:MAG: DUF4384 domain-containing protein [Lachnospiraceae bacterium]|nr:DUF4384 domain-containing protein [Lachnospiraceae bacterium]